MKRPLAVALTLAAFTLAHSAAAPAHAETAPSPAARLVSDVKGVRAGEPFTIGVLIEIPDGWHVYWKGTGGTGIPTTLELSLPRGFKADEVLYPTPARFTNAAQTTTGYDKAVLLSARITPPADLANVSSVSIGVRAGWLCCDEERCVPGDAELAFAVPVVAATTRDADGAALIETWRARLPREIVKGSGVELSNAKGLAPGAKKGRLEATLTLPEEARKPDVFAAAPDALDVLKVAAKLDGKTVLVALDVEVLEGQKLESAALEVVLAYETLGGERRGIRFSLPLRN